MNKNSSPCQALVWICNSIASKLCQIKFQFMWKPCETKDLVGVLVNVDDQVMYQRIQYWHVNFVMQGVIWFRDLGLDG